MCRAIILILIVLHTLSLAENSPIWKGPSDKKQIALTFDDGPTPEQTIPVLNILDNYAVKATFFVVGKKAETYPDIILRLSQQRHDIGNHTYSHPNLTQLSYHDIKEELVKTNRILERIIQKPVQYFRPPGGKLNKKVKQVLKTTHMENILWGRKSLGLCNSTKKISNPRRGERDDLS